jgi:hypothetical protein
MKIALQSAALAVMVALVPAGARTEDKPALKVLYDIALDLDHDGKLDRAAVVQDPASIYAALYIYLGAGAGPLDLTRQPSFLKKDLTTEPVIGLAGNGKGTLIVKYGRVGLGSNQYEMRLTIARRGGEFWVAGFSASWDMRDGSLGSCDIDFLTGKGVAARGHGRNKPIKAKLRPVKLADWSQDKQPKACR